jgi:hypothetical protein
MRIHTITTEDPAEVCMVRRFIADFKTSNTHPGYIKSTARSGKVLLLALEYTELDVSAVDAAMATEEYASVSGDLVGRFREFCGASGVELKLTMP